MTTEDDVVKALQSHNFRQAHDLVDDLEDEYATSTCATCGRPVDDCRCAERELRYQKEVYYSER